jgi:hypothetical protein
MRFDSSSSMTFAKCITSAPLCGRRCQHKRGLCASIVSHKGVNICSVRCLTVYFPMVASSSCNEVSSPSPASSRRPSSFGPHKGLFCDTGHVSLFVAAALRLIEGDCWLEDWPSTPLVRLARLPPTASAKECENGPSMRRGSSLDRHDGDGVFECAC